jgi:hypothetical protein
LKPTDAAALFSAHPERYATTGLQWSNPSHYPDLANGLFQVLMSNLAKQQGLNGRPPHRTLLQQQARIEQRLSVVERAAHRHGQHIPPRIEDAQVIFALEKMADGLEIAADFRATHGDSAGNIFPGTMLDVAVGFAAAVRGHRALERFSIGPFGALSKIAGFITRPDVLVEFEDLPALAQLVEQARLVPVGYVVVPENESCAAFHERMQALMDVVRQRNQPRRE